MNGVTDLRREWLYTQMGRVSSPVLPRRQGEEQLRVQADKLEMQRFNDPRGPAVQRAVVSRRSRGRANTDDRQVATTIVTVEFKEDRIAGFTVNPDLRSERKITTS